jgi:formyl-CoA transferase
MLLADMGADVVKIENPDGGDTLRSWPPITNGFSENFASLNRNKRSVTLDLKNPADLAKAQALIGDADILIENNRPGVMDRLGIGYEAMRKLNPKLIYCSISAYGQSGPRSQEGGFDLTVQAMSGIMSITGEPGGPPVKCGVPISDFSAGLYGAFAIVSALRSVAQSGEGTHLDISMLGSSLGIAALQTSEYFGTGRDPVKLGSAHPRNAPYQAFRCRDGYFGMAAGNNALW